MAATEKSSSNSADTQQAQQAQQAQPAAAQHHDGPPNGGFQAWLQVLAAFCLYFNTWGLIASYGSFQAFYETDLLRHHSSFQISTIGSLQSFLLVFLGFITGPIYDAGYARVLLGVGSVLAVAGTVAQSFCTHFWQLLLAQGFCVGLGAGCVAVLNVAITSLWFTTRLPIANGIAASGSGLGGSVLPIMIRSLLGRVGFAWTVRAVALVVLVTMISVNAVLRLPNTNTNPSPNRRRALFDSSALTDRPFLLFVAGCFLVFLGMYTPFTYVSSYAIDSGLATSAQAFYTLAALNLASIPGRVVPLLFAQRVGALNMLAGATLLLGAMAFCFCAATRTAAAVFGVAAGYGFLAGTFFALQPTVVVRLAPSPAVIGTRFGMMFSVLSVALLFGTPVAGALERSYGYWAAWVWCGVVSCAGAAMMLCSRAAKVGVGMVKV